MLPFEKVRLIFFIYLLLGGCVRKQEQTESHSIQTPADSLRAIDDAKERLKQFEKKEEQYNAEHPALHELQLTELGLAWSPEKIYQILRSCTGTLDSSTFGRLDKRISEYSLTPVKWWGIEGNLVVRFTDDKSEEFISPIGTSQHVRWLASNLTKQDLKIIAEQIDKSIGNHDELIYGGMLYNWYKTDRAYRLRLDGSGAEFYYEPNFRHLTNSYSPNSE